jgi:peptidoglycan/LPS O-acetylase OafA/YrhL
MKDARFEALDAWRGICAVLIVIFHFISIAPGAMAHALFVRNAYLFVDFFFVLSGFVLCHTYRNRISGMRDLGHFVLRRFARIWPLHAVVFGSLLVSIGVLAVLPHPASLNLTWSGDTYSVFAIVPTLLLLNAMNVTGTAVWNGPAWSIGAEFYTYLLFALILIFASRRLIAASIAISAVALFVVFWKAPDLMNTTYDYGAVRCLAGFFCGVAAYHCFERRSGPGLGAATAQEIATLVLVVGFVIHAGDGPDSVHPSSLAAPLVFAVAVVTFAGEGGLLSVVLRTRPL